MCCNTFQHSPTRDYLKQEPCLTTFNHRTVTMLCTVCKSVKQYIKKLPVDTVWTGCMKSIDPICLPHVITKLMLVFLKYMFHEWSIITFLSKSYLLAAQRIQTTAMPLRYRLAGYWSISDRKGRFDCISSTSSVAL